MSWLVLSWFLTLGLVPQNDQMLVQSHDAIYTANPCFEQTAGLSLTALDHARAFFAIKTYEVKSNSLLFAPFRSDYSIGAEVFSRNIILGIKHECDHPVVSNPGSFASNGYYLGTTEVYLTFHGSMHF
jgi:hypothetical protein